MIDPGLLAGTPYRSKTAYEDMIGTIAVVFNGLVEQTTLLTGTSVALYTFDSNEETDDILEQIQNQARAISRGLGIADPPDLQSFNLREESDWVSWTFLMAGELKRLKDAAGVI